MLSLEDRHTRGHPPRRMPTSFDCSYAREFYHSSLANTYMDAYLGQWPLVCFLP